MPDFPITDPNQVDPSLIPAVDGPILQPGQVPVGSVPQPPSQFGQVAPMINQGLAQGAGSVGYSGPTAQGQQRAQGMLGQIDQRVRAFEQKDAAQTNNELTNYWGAVQGEKNAIGAIPQVHDQYEQQLGTIEVQKQALFEEAARQTEAARQEAKVSAAQFNNQYQQQLAAVRAMTVDIAGPLGRLSTGETAGLSLALFAQGFLAAQGININVSQQVDRWVDRSIQEQQRQIGQAEQGAHDTFNLYKIAQEQSANELEARQRYRGFIIEGLKSQTELTAARYQSRLATSQAGVAIAKLDTEATITQANMIKQHEHRVLQEKQWETETAFKLAQVNLENQKLDIERKKLDASKVKKEDKFKVIIDPSDGKAKWVVRGDRLNADEDSKEATKAAVDYNAVDKELKKAIQFRESALKGDKFGHSFFDSYDEAKRQYQAMVTSLAVQTAKTNFGTRSTDKEFERITSLIPFDKWYQRGNNSAIWDDFRENLREAFDGEMLQRADAIPADSQFAKEHNIANPGAKAEHSARVSGGEPVTKFATEEAAKVVAKDSDDVEQSYGSKLYGHFAKSNRDSQFTKAGYKDPQDHKPGEYQKLKMPGYAVAIDHLVNGYLNPDTVKKFGDDNKIYVGTKNDSPDEISQESLEVLKQIASGSTTGATRDSKGNLREDVPKEAKAYAKYILSLDRNELKRVFDSDPYGGSQVSRPETEEPLLQEFGLQPRILPREQMNILE